MCFAAPEVQNCIFSHISLVYERYYLEGTTIETGLSCFYYGFYTSQYLVAVGNPE